jgi:hypothetical protein
MIELANDGRSPPAQAVQFRRGRNRTRDDVDGKY